MVGRILAVAFTVGLLGVSGPAHAILIPVGNTTVDTDTGFAWLDLTETEGMSPNAALAAHPDFRFGLDTEVVTLFLNGGMTAADAVARTEDFADATSLLALLGTTLVSVTIPPLAQGFAEDSARPGFFFVPFVQADNGSLTGRAGFVGVYAHADFTLQDAGVFLVKAVAVPEPATLGLLGLGLTALGLARRRTRR